MKFRTAEQALAYQPTTLRDAQAYADALEQHAGMLDFLGNATNTMVGPTIDAKVAALQKRRLEVVDRINAILAERGLTGWDAMKALRTREWLEAHGWDVDAMDAHWKARK